MIFLNRHRVALLLVLAAAYVTLFVGWGGGGFPLDDSWIHQSYGRNLAQRGEWALIPGQPSAASTAPLYTLALAVGYLVRAPYQLWAHLLGILALWGGGVFGANLAQRAAPNTRNAGLLAGVLLVSTWQLVWAAASGMETALFAMWVTLLPLMAWRESDVARNRDRPATVRRGIAFGVVAGLAVLTRPEGILAAGLCGLAVLFARRDALPNVMAWAIGAAVGFALLIAPYLWLNLSLTGGLLPNTSAAKQVQHAPLLAQSYGTRLRNMTLPLFIGGQVFLLPGIAAYLWWSARNAAQRTAYHWVLPLWALGLVALYAARLPAAYQHGRYVMSALPALVIIGAVGTLWLVQWAGRRRVTRIPAQVVLLASLVSYAAMLFGVTPGIYARDVAVINQEMVTVASWLDENIPPQELVAIHDIGAVAYFTPRPMLDIAGLVSPEVIPSLNDPAALWSLMEARGAVYLAAFPNQIPGGNPNDPRLCEMFTTGGEAALALGAANMAVYRFAWNGACETR